MGVGRSRSNLQLATFRHKLPEWACFFFKLNETEGRCCELGGYGGQRSRFHEFRGTENPKHYSAPEYRPCTYTGIHRFEKRPSFGYEFKAYFSDVPVVVHVFTSRHGERRNCGWHG